VFNRYFVQSSPWMIPRRTRPWKIRCDASACHIALGISRKTWS
jgi:hypothetical protein